MVCLSIAYHFRFFKGCLTQILLGPFLKPVQNVSRKSKFRRIIVQTIQKSDWVIVTPDHTYRKNESRILPFEYAYLYAQEENDPTINSGDC